MCSGQRLRDEALSRGDVVVYVMEVVATLGPIYVIHQGRSTGRVIGIAMETTHSGVCTSVALVTFPPLTSTLSPHMRPVLFEKVPRLGGL